MNGIGFRSSNIGQYGIQDFSWGPRGSTFSPAGNVWDPPGTGTQSPFFSDNPILDAVGSAVTSWVAERIGPPITSFPSVYTPDPRPEAGVPVGPYPVPEAVVPQTEEQTTYVIDPEARPEFVVYEDAPAGIYEVERKETDWDEVYRQYVELNAPKVEETGMWDWFENATALGNLGTAVGWWGGGDQVAASAPAGAAPGGATMPAKVTVDTRTGKVTACKRRRRRKLLTESDFNVLLRVATLPNKENVRIVLGKAIGRS